MIPGENKKLVDCIMAKKRKKTFSPKGSVRKGEILKQATYTTGGAVLGFSKFWNKVFNALGEFKLSLGLVFRLLFASKIGLVLAILMIAVPLTAFEAHVVNVTATIERRPCEEFEVRSMGYWRNHPENRIFPQTVGDTTVTNDAEADAVFDLPNNVLANKLKKQLLALKFSIAYFGAGGAIVGGGDNTTLSQLATQADAALLADPQVRDTLAFYHNLIEEINTSEIVSTCDQFFEPLLCGDIDLDGDVDRDDITRITDYIFEGEPIPEAVNVDMNGDGAPDILDVVTLTNYVSRGGPAPTCGAELPSSESTSFGASVLDAVSPEGDTSIEEGAASSSEAVSDQTENSTSTSSETPIDQGMPPDQTSDESTTSTESLIPEDTASSTDPGGDPAPSPEPVVEPTPEPLPEPEPQPQPEP